MKLQLSVLALCVALVRPHTVVRRNLDYDEEGDYGEGSYGIERGYGGGGHVQVVRINIPHPVPVAVLHPMAVAVPQPYAVHVRIPEPIEVPVVKTVKVPVEKPVAVHVEKIVPFPVEKRYPVAVERPVPFPVPQPYPVKVPVVKTIHHYVKGGGGHTGGRHKW